MCIKMSDVRLSNASPTLERVDARQPDSLRPPVRRNLYGRPDPGEIQRNLAAVVQGDVLAFREKYNFDPVSDTPLTPRNYDWQEDSNAPEFYLRAAHGSQRPRGDAHSAGDNQREDAAEAAERIDTPAGNRSRKRRSADLDPCNSECQSKRSHTDDDDDEDQADGVESQAEERPSRPKNGAEVQ